MPPGRPARLAAREERAGRGCAAAPGNLLLLAARRGVGPGRWQAVGDHLESAHGLPGAVYALAVLCSASPGWGRQGGGLSRSNLDATAPVPGSPPTAHSSQPIAPATVSRNLEAPRVPSSSLHLADLLHPSSWGMHTHTHTLSHIHSLLAVFPFPFLPTPALKTPL